MAIHNPHDFHAFSALCGSDLCPAAFRHNEGRINEAFFFIECTSVAKFVSDIRQHSTQNFIAAPTLKAPMYGFVVRIALRQHVLRTGAEKSTAPLQGRDAWEPAFDRDAHPECFLLENDSGCVPTASP